MLQECPHCHTMVLPKQDGKCPACQKYFSDTSNIDSTTKLIDLKHRSSLPPICINCGKPTERTVILEERLEISIPQCKDCAKSIGKPKPERVNFEDGNMTFLVHIEFYNEVTGSNSKKHDSSQSDPSFRMKVDGVYTIRNIGISITGEIERGALHIGDEIHVIGKDLAKKIIVGGILVNHKEADEASANMKVEIQLPKLEKEDVKRGDTLIA